MANGYENELALLERLNYSHKRSLRFVQNLYPDTDLTWHFIGEQLRQQITCSKDEQRKVREF